MQHPVIHSGVTPALSPEIGSMVLAVGAIVLSVIVYDIYRNQWPEWMGQD